MVAREFLKQHWRSVLAVSLVVAVFLAGYAAHRPATITKAEQRTEDESAGLDLRVHEEKGPRVVYRDRTVVHEVLSPAGQVQERTTTRDNSVIQSGPTTKDTQEKVKDDLHVATKTTEVVREEGRWAVRLLAGADTRGGIVAGAAADFRLVGPFTVGAWGLAPVAGAPTGWAAGVAVGLRL